MRFELTQTGFTVQCSNRLSYGHRDDGWDRTSVGANRSANGLCRPAPDHSATSSAIRIHREERRSTRRAWHRGEPESAEKSRERTVRPRTADFTDRADQGCSLSAQWAKSAFSSSSPRSPRLRGESSSSVCSMLSVVNPQFSAPRRDRTCRFLIWSQAPRRWSLRRVASRFHFTMHREGLEPP